MHLTNTISENLPKHGPGFSFTYLLLHFFHLLAVLVEDVFADEVGALELFVAERTEPLVPG